MTRQRAAVRAERDSGAARVGTVSINDFGSNYFPGVSIYECAGRYGLRRWAAG